MWKKPIDIVTIGDITTDAFIRLQDASVHCKVDHKECELCMRFGDKIPFEYVKVIKGVGNSANAACAAAKLGLRTAIVTNIGDDQNGKDCEKDFQDHNVITSFVKIHKNKPTNYHFVLWYESDRTILVNHIEYDYRLPSFPSPKWLYLTSLASNSFSYHFDIANYLEKNPEVKLAFQPGTFQIKLGVHELERIYQRSDILIVNYEEAERIVREAHRSAETEQSNEKENAGTQNKSSSDKLGTRHEIKSLLKKLSGYGPKIVIVTDDTNGAYMFDGDHCYHMPMYPDPRPAFERTGCGDAFSATFVSALAMGKTPLEALVWAPVNPMSVAQFIGSKEGLLSLDQLEWWLSRAPEEYRPKEI